MRDKEYEAKISSYRKSMYEILSIYGRTEAKGPILIMEALIAGEQAALDAYKLTDEYKDNTKFTDSEIEDLVSKVEFSDSTWFVVHEYGGPYMHITHRFPSFDEVRQFLRNTTKGSNWSISPPKGYWHSAARD